MQCVMVRGWRDESVAIESKRLCAPEGVADGGTQGSIETSVSYHARGACMLVKYVKLDLAR